MGGHFKSYNGEEIIKIARLLNDTSTVSIKSLREDGLFDSSIYFYPNPNNGYFVIESRKVITVEILNPFGEIIFNSLLSIGKNNIELENVDSGVYYVSTFDDDGFRSFGRLIVIN